MRRSRAPLVVIVTPKRALTPIGIGPVRFWYCCLRTVHAEGYKRFVWGHVPRRGHIVDRTHRGHYRGSRECSLVEFLSAYCAAYMRVTPTVRAGF